jgi:small subunit ribosomal protein S4
VRLNLRVKVADAVEVKDKSKQLAPVLEAIAPAQRDVPDYIDVDHTRMTAKLTRVPTLSEVPCW